MTLQDLAALVARMRQAQRDYFRSQSTAALLVAKDLERKVDAAVKDVAQPSLFGETEAT